MLDYTDSFTCKKRANASYFYTLKDDPINDDLRSLIRAIHVDLFYDSAPDDWIYEQVYHAFERLAECETGEDFEIALIQVEGDAYTNGLLEWAKSGYAQAYIQETLDDINPNTIDDLIREAQVRAIQAIYSYVWEFLTMDDCKKEGCGNGEIEAN